MRTNGSSAPEPLQRAERPVDERSIPSGVRDDSEALFEWAGRALDVSRQAGR